eukprot:SAG31_NODE_5231_length_2659_cov_37.454297_2_plen_69_part_00
MRTRQHVVAVVVVVANSTAMDFATGRLDGPMALDGAGCRMRRRRRSTAKLQLCHSDMTVVQQNITNIV